MTQKLTETINAFSMRCGHDRRTVQRRLRAAGKKYVGTAGVGFLYMIADMESVMRDQEKELQALATIRKLENCSLDVFLEISDNFRSCVALALEKYHHDEATIDTLTLLIWDRMADSFAEQFEDQLDEGDNPHIVLKMSATICKLAEKYNINVDETNAIKNAFLKK